MEYMRRVEKKREWERKERKKKINKNPRFEKAIHHHSDHFITINLTQPFIYLYI